MLGLTLSQVAALPAFHPLSSPANPTIFELPCQSTIRFCLVTLEDGSVAPQTNSRYSAWLYFSPCSQWLPNCAKFQLQLLECAMSQLTVDQLQVRCMWTA